jgi:hypothetical protein
LIGVHAESADARDGESEIRFLQLGKLLDVLGAHDLFGEAPQVFLLERWRFDRDHLAIDAQRRRASNLEVEIRRVGLNHVLQDRLVVERLACRDGGLLAACSFRFFNH